MLLKQKIKNFMALIIRTSKYMIFYKNSKSSKISKIKIKNHNHERLLLKNLFFIFNFIWIFLFFFNFGILKYNL